MYIFTLTQTALWIKIQTKCQTNGLSKNIRCLTPGPSKLEKVVDPGSGPGVHYLVLFSWEN